MEFKEHRCVSGWRLLIDGAKVWRNWEKIKFRSMLSNFLPIFLIILLYNTSSMATGLDQDLYVTNGTVFSIVANDTTLFIGGDFDRIGKRTGNMVEIDAQNGSRNEDFPEIVGTVNVIISDGQEPNGWYIAGKFAYVGGYTISTIAHINSDYSVDTLFYPTGSYQLDGPIRTMVLDTSGENDILYVGGEFTAFLGYDLPGLVAINTVTQQISSVWVPAPSDGLVKTSVDALALSGTTLYVAGDFTSIGDQSRTGLAALETLNVDNSTGQAITDWDPSPGAGTVHTMILSGSTLYVGGTFTHIGGQSRPKIAAIDVVGINDGTGKANALWNPDVTGSSVDVMSLSNNVLYVGGKFSAIGGSMRNNLAAIDTVAAGDGTGRTNGIWDPNIIGDIVSSIVADDINNRLYIGGDFTQVGNIGRNHIAAVDSALGGDGTGDPDTSWNPNANLPVYALVLSGDNNLIAGGKFNSLGGEVRNRIAAIDRSTGQPTLWNPDANGRISTMVIDGNMLYVGGQFTNIGGQNRNRIAALNITKTSEMANNFNPNANDTVHTILLSSNGTVLYVGGEFTQIGGQSRQRIAALNITENTDTASGWNPGANGDIHAMVLNNELLYVGGEFTQIGGENRNRIAALDTTKIADNTTSWNPDVGYADAGTSAVYAMAISGTTLYVGGDFDTIGGITRNHIAALDTTTDTENVADWDPNIDGPLYTMYLFGTSLYVGGDFDWVAGDGINDETDPSGYDMGTYHPGIAVLDILRENNYYIYRTWNPYLKNGLDETRIYAVLRKNNTLYAAGSFFCAAGRPASNIAQFNFTPPTVTIDVPSGTYPKEQFIAIQCDAADGFECDSAYYTLDGTDPTPYSSIALWGGAYIEKSATLKYIAIDNAGAVSEVGTAEYQIKFEDVVCFIEAVKSDPFTQLWEKIDSYWRRYFSK